MNTNNIRLKDIPLLLLVCAIFLVMVICSFKLSHLIIYLQNKYFFNNSVYIASLFSNYIFVFGFAFFSLSIIIDLIFMVLDMSNFYPKTKTYLKTIVLKMLFLIIMSIVAFFNYCRINETGIFYNRLFGFSEKYIPWTMIENISIYPEIVSTGTRTINYKIVRRFDIVTNEKVIEIWQDESIAKHNYVEILSLVNFIKTNTNLKINVIDKFDEKMIELLKRQGNEAEMINEFRHLHSAVHGRM